MRPGGPKCRVIWWVAWRMQHNIDIPWIRRSNMGDHRLSHRDPSDKQPRPQQRANLRKPFHAKGKNTEVCTEC